MRIIKYSQNGQPEYSRKNLYPDQFVSEKEKSSDDWVKDTIDYFYNMALSQYEYKEKTIVPNYQLVKGDIKPEHFYREPEVKQFIDSLVDEESLPSYVQSYSILSPPINLLVGELSQRPDNVFVKAFDADSQAEELQVKSEILQNYIASKVHQRILQKAAMNGVELSEEDFQMLSEEALQNDMVSYTTQGERYGSRMLEYLKMRFVIKEKSETAFQDLLKCGQEYYHIREDNSAIGFNVDVVNPRNVGFLSTGNKVYTSNPLDEGDGVYAAWILEVMEVSELIHKFNLDTKTIEHLTDISEQAYQISARKSPLAGGPINTGILGVEYDTYDPGLMMYQRTLEAEIGYNQDEVSSMAGTFNSSLSIGNKYLVLTVYYKSKKKIGKLTYIDVDGNLITEFVDETYKKGTHPQEVSIEWRYINQWRKGIKIGNDVYEDKPFNLLDYCPIIGAFFDPKNTKAPKGLVDLLKPHQGLYNIAMNDMWRLLEKDMGVVFLTSIRHVPTPKDGDRQDAIDIWKTKGKEEGFIFIDDSPENTKVPTSFNQHTAVNLSRAAEIQARYDLAVAIRNEAWKLVGISEQRLGSSRATETATGINTALTQSYAQTEPWFTHHENLLTYLYQAILDAAIFIESHKPVSTIGFITSAGERSWAEINGSQLKNIDLGIFVTNRSEDQRTLESYRQFAQHLIQNGALAESAEVVANKSVRDIKQILAKFGKHRRDIEQQNQALQQQQLQQQQAQFEQAQQLAQLQDEKNKAFEAYENQLDRIAKERIAIINNQQPVVGPTELDNSRFELDRQRADREYQLRLQDLTTKQRQILEQTALQREKLAIEKEKIAVTRENMLNDEKIEKLRIQNSKAKKST